MSDLLPAPAGYRLHTLEILRWGTFDGDKFHKLDLFGRSGCVTGPNGGGKSTAVDALLTLLVPPAVRHYNVAASGEGKKKERTIATYVRGAWSRTESAETGKGQASFLRSTGVPSVLLAVFKDELIGKVVTLAQIHWINASGAHEARFLIKQAEAHIPDLNLGKNPVTHRTPFEDANWYYGQSFDEYLGKFRSLLRIPDERALRLLCRTVSMKDITDLNVFVRDLMLEPREPGELLDDLERHYENLHKISEEIRMAEEETQLLAPIASDFEAYEKAAVEVKKLTDVRRASELFFVETHAQLLDAEIERVGLEVDTARHQAEIAKADAEAALAEYLRLKLRLEEHDVGKAISEKKATRARLAEDRVRRVKRAEDYKRLLSFIGHLGTVENESTFNQLRQKAVAGKGSAATSYESATGKLGEIKRERETLDVRREAIEAELKLLGRKPSKIPMRFLLMRARIAEELSLSEGDLPFVGELLDVIAEEVRWRPTIERFLYPFAIAMVVPDEHYARVSDHLDAKDPGSSVSYYPARRGTGFNLPPDRARLYGKLTIKSGTWAATWLGAELFNRFDHLCTDDMRQFRKEAKVLTPQLHGKARGGRHTRHSKQDEEHMDYDVLGWTNTEKIARLDEQFRQAGTRRKTLEELERSTRDAQTRARNEEVTWGKIADFPTFTEIDVATLDDEIESLRIDIEKLTASSNEFKTLEKQVNEAKTHSDGLSDARTAAEQAHGKVIERHDGLKDERGKLGKKLNQAAADEFPWREHVEAITALLKEELSLSSLASQRESVFRKIDGRSRTAESERDQAKDAVVGQVGRVKEACKERAFAKDITVSIEAAPSLVRHLEKLDGEALPALRSKFDEMMQENLLKHVFTLNADLLEQVRDIKERIAEVNQTLATIDYNPGTYVFMRERESLDKSVGNFRTLLQACLARQILQTRAEIKESFMRLKALIDYVKQNREAALIGANTNHWLTFAVIESERGTNHQVTVSSDSAGDSGGQKAKLAFTILAAALCFQFRHSRQRDSNAFRLVMVDEMFSKSDDENSRYALDLFTRFDYQLLLVTPMEGKARLPMPYVKTYHLVSNPTKKASTVTHATVEMVVAKEKELLARRQSAGA